jgi:uncharacterized protein with von Willebrand factor type A (vWA) domain
MREVSGLIDSMVERKTGSERVSVRLTDEQENRIMDMAPKNFKERKRV